MTQFLRNCGYENTNYQYPSLSMVSFLWFPFCFLYPIWKILENSSSNFPKFQFLSIIYWMSFPVTGLFHAPKFNKCQLYALPYVYLQFYLSRWNVTVRRANSKILKKSRTTNFECKARTLDRTASNAWTARTAQVGWTGGTLNRTSNSPNAENNLNSENDE